MGNSKSSNRISAHDKAILDMKNQRDKVKQYQKRITVLTDRERAIAKECLSKGDKRRALLALRRKKYQESLLAKTDQQLAQLEILTSDIEFALVQKDVVFGLQQGSKVLKEIQREIGGVESVEKLMGENEEALAYQKEIDEMLGGRMTNQEEDEVEEELEALEVDVKRVTLPDLPMQTSPRTEQEQKGAHKVESQRKTTVRDAPDASEPILA